MEAGTLEPQKELKTGLYTECWACTISEALKIYWKHWGPEHWPTSCQLWFDEAWFHHLDLVVASRPFWNAKMQIVASGVWPIIFCFAQPAWRPWRWVIPLGSASWFSFPEVKVLIHFWISRCNHSYDQLWSFVGSLGLAEVLSMAPKLASVLGLGSIRSQCEPLGAAPPFLFFWFQQFTFLSLFTARHSPSPAALLLHPHPSPTGAKQPPASHSSVDWSSRSYS